MSTLILMIAIWFADLVSVFANFKTGAIPHDEKSLIAYGLAFIWGALTSVIVERMLRK